MKREIRERIEKVLGTYPRKPPLSAYKQSKRKLPKTIKFLKPFSKTVNKPPHKSTCLCGTCRKCKHRLLMRDWRQKKALKAKWAAFLDGYSEECFKVKSSLDPTLYIRLVRQYH